jgi:glutathione S-transferase
MRIPHSLDIASSIAASSAAQWRGTSASKKTTQPEKLLELYEFENCPYSRMVREVLTELDLDATIYPCPKDGTRFRAISKEKAGESQFPFLVDPNTGKSMLESAEIIEYLFQTYGGRSTPARLKESKAKLAGSFAASAARGMKGVRVAASKLAPKELLELYSFESSPYSRLVRERLCELEIPYIVRSFGKYQRSDMGPSWVRSNFYPDDVAKGRNRVVLQQRAGKMQVPYLIDPNTGSEMFECQDILAYLDSTYAA